MLYSIIVNKLNHVTLLKSFLKEKTAVVSLTTWQFKFLKQIPLIMIKKVILYLSLNNIEVVKPTPWNC